MSHNRIVHVNLGRRHVIGDGRTLHQPSMLQESCNKALYDVPLKTTYAHPAKNFMLARQTAMETLLGSGSLPETRGRIIQNGDMNVLVTYHPTASTYTPELKQSLFEDIKALRTELE